MSTKTIGGYRAFSVYDPATGTTVQINNPLASSPGLKLEPMFNETGMGKTFAGINAECEMHFPGDDGIRNRFLYSREFDNAYWQKGNTTVTPNTTAGVDGTTLADTLTEDGANTSHNLFRLNVSVDKAGLQGVFARVKRGTGSRHVRLQIQNGSSTNVARVFFDLTNLAVAQSETVGTGFVSASGIIPLANGYYQIWFLGGIDTTSTTMDAYLFMQANSTGTSIYTGDSSSSLIVDGFQIESGGLTEFQVTGAALVNTFTVLRDWMTNRTPVRLVAAGVEKNIQWYESTQLFFELRRNADARQGLYTGVVKLSYVGDLPAVYNNENLLAFLGWQDTSPVDTVPDGWTNNGIASTSFSSSIFTGTYDADGDLLSAEIEFPISGTNVKFSSDFTAVSSNGGIRIRLRTFAGGALADYESSFTTIGIKQSNGLTLVSTFRLNLSIRRTAGGATTTNGVRNPALTVNGQLTPGTSFMNY